VWRTASSSVDLRRRSPGSGLATCPIESCASQTLSPPESMSTPDARCLLRCAGAGGAGAEDARRAGVLLASGASRLSDGHAACAGDDAGLPAALEEFELGTAQCAGRGGTATAGSEGTGVARGNGAQAGQDAALGSKPYGGRGGARPTRRYCRLCRVCPWQARRGRASSSCALRLRLRCACERLGSSSAACFLTLAAWGLALQLDHGAAAATPDSVQVQGQAQPRPETRHYHATPVSGPGHPQDTGVHRARMRS